MLASRAAAQITRRGAFAVRRVGVAQPRRTASAAASSHTPADSLVDSSKVMVKNDQWGGAGAYATVAIESGEVVEKGIVRVLTNVDGNENPYVFTWSDERPCTTWAIGSGCSTFYNTAEEAESNTHMERNFVDNTFVITATKDIPAGGELLHLYKSKGWRTCFAELN